MNDNAKKLDRHPLAVCHIVRGPGFKDRPIDPFNERLGSETLAYDSLAEFAAQLAKDPRGEVQIVAALGNITIDKLLVTEIEALKKIPAKTGKLPLNGITTSILLNWDQSKLSLRNMAVAAETLVGTGFNGTTFEPTRILGWGFAKSSEALDPGTDPTKVLRHITQAFTRRYCRDGRLEAAKSLYANVVARAVNCPPHRFNIAFDGAALLCSFEGSCGEGAQVSIHNAARRLAIWLDQANGLTRNTLTGWVRQKAPSTIETGVIFDAIDLQTALIIEPRLEQTSQVSYNVA